MKKFTASLRERVDLFLVRELGISRAKVSVLIKGAGVFVDKKPVKASYVLSEGEVVAVKDFDFSEQEIQEEEFGFEVLYEDKACLVINKPAGVVVHAGNDGKHRSGTVVNAFLGRVGRAEFGESERAGVVHRLDKDTSGILILAKTEAALADLAAQFKKRKVKKFYDVLVFGRLAHRAGVIDSPIGRSLADRKKMAILTEEAGGKEAKSKYSMVKEFKVEDIGVVSLLRVEIFTGRTHQIRVHLAAIGHPVVGDGVYGARNLNGRFKAKFELARQFLHAAELEFVSPDTKKVVAVKAEWDEELARIAGELEN